MLIFIIIGSVLIVFGAFELFVFIMNKIYFKSETKGTVVKLDNSKGQEIPVYSYTINEKEYESLLVPELYDKTDYKVGQENVLQYNMKNPEAIKLKHESYKKVYFMYGGAIIVGVIIIILALKGILKM